jgi:ribosomal protein S18 acetylase RimI-like enzyme
MQRNVKIIQLDIKSKKTLFKEVANLHIKEIESGFLTYLGERFLTQLYRFISGSRSSFLIVALHNDEVIGFICGSSNTKRLFVEFIVRYGFIITPLLLPKFLHYKTVSSAFETIRYPYKQANITLPRSEILNFCVSNHTQRQGIGRKLFNALVSEYQNRKISEIKIVTGRDQFKAQKFYESLGAKLSRKFEIHKGADSLIYTFPIPDSKNFVS